MDAISARKCINNATRAKNDCRRERIFSPIECYLMCACVVSSDRDENEFLDYS